MAVFILLYLLSLGCKALSEKAITGLKSCLFMEVLNGAQAVSEPVNPWTDNFLNALIGQQRKGCLKSACSYSYFYFLEALKPMLVFTLISAHGFNLIIAPQNSIVFANKVCSATLSKLCVTLQVVLHVILCTDGTICYVE